MINLNPRSLPEAAPLLKANSLSFYRGESPIFTEVDFQLQAGESVYLQGDNGSGKSSLLQTVAGILAYQQGELFWRDQNVQDYAPLYHRDLIYLGHQLALKPYLTVLEHWQFYAALAQTSLMPNLAEYWQLESYLQIPIGQLSEGQKRKVALARLQIQPASIWLLDEPFVALDQFSQNQLNQLVANHQGISMVTSHQWQHQATQCWKLVQGKLQC